VEIGKVAGEMDFGQLALARSCIFRPSEPAAGQEQAVVEQVMLVDKRPSGRDSARVGRQASQHPFLGLVQREESP
jgi:hypothetical protein